MRAPVKSPFRIREFVVLRRSHSPRYSFSRHTYRTSGTKENVNPIVATMRSYWSDEPLDMMPICSWNATRNRPIAPNSHAANNPSRVRRNCSARTASVMPPTNSGRFTAENGYSPSALTPTPNAS